jgi:hypothetical protein
MDVARSVSVSILMIVFAWNECHDGLGALQSMAGDSFSA